MVLGFHLVLTGAQKRALTKALVAARQRGDLRVVNRLLAVLGIAEGKTTLAGLASVLRVSAQAIGQWIKQYLLGGVKALKRPPGRPPMTQEATPGARGVGQRWAGGGRFPGRLLAHADDSGADSRPLWGALFREIPQ